MDDDAIVCLVVEGSVEQEGGGEEGEGRGGKKNELMYCSVISVRPVFTVFDIEPRSFHRPMCGISLSFAVFQVLVGWVESTDTWRANTVVWQREMARLVAASMQ